VNNAPGAARRVVRRSRRFLQGSRALAVNILTEKAFLIFVSKFVFLFAYTLTQCVCAAF
jgi:hypothetical protein